LSSSVQDRIEKKPGSNQGRQIGTWVNSNFAEKFAADLSSLVFLLLPLPEPPNEKSPKLTPALAPQPEVSLLLCVS